MTELSVRQNVLDELEFEPAIDAAHIGVAVDKGVIILSGHVGSYAEKVAAVAAARRVKGVRAIADEIQVRFPYDKKTADDEIAKRAIDILGWDTLVPRNTIAITVREGWVTLEGEVNWHFQRTAAETDVRKLSGVRAVINNIKLKPSVQPADVERKIENALKRHAEIEASAIRVTMGGPNKVILEGTVSNWDERHAVAAAAWSAPGITAVDDRLEIA